MLTPLHFGRKMKGSFQYWQNWQGIFLEFHHLHVERLFSIAGKVFTPDRCRLKDSRFEQLMFIRCNNTETD